MIAFLYISIFCAWMFPMLATAELWVCPQSSGPDLYTDQPGAECHRFELSPPNEATTSLDPRLRLFFVRAWQAAGLLKRCEEPGLKWFSEWEQTMPSKRARLEKDSFIMQECINPIMKVWLMETYKQEERKVICARKMQKYIQDLLEARRTNMPHPAAPTIKECQEDQ